MPDFIYEPAETHARRPLTIKDGEGIPRRVMAGERFQAADLSPFAEHLARVPGRVVAGERRPCIVPVGVPAAPAPSPTDLLALASGVAAVLGDIKALLGLPSTVEPPEVLDAVRTLRMGIDALAVRVGLPDGSRVDEVVARVVATDANTRGALGEVARKVDADREQFNRLAVAVGLPAYTSPDQPEHDTQARPVMATLESTEGPPAPILDPALPTHHQPDAIAGPLGPAVRPIEPGDPPVPPAVVDVEAPPGRRVQYEEADLPETNAGLEKLAADNGVELKRDDKRNRETRIEALRRAGLVVGGEG